jgi:hypothetical protein
MGVSDGRTAGTRLRDLLATGTVLAVACSYLEPGNGNSFNTVRARSPVRDHDRASVEHRATRGSTGTARCRPGESPWNPDEIRSISSSINLLEGRTKPGLSR